MLITFKLSSAAWLNKLVAISKVMSSKPVANVLENIRFTMTDTMLQMEAADAEAFIYTQMTPDESQGTGQFGVNARTLIDGLKELADQPITITINNSKILRVDYQNGNFNIPLADMDCWPEYGIIEDSTETKIESTTLRNIIRCCLPYCANDDLRPVMNGLSFNFLEESLEVAASDGHRLVRLQYNMPCEKGNFILSQRIAKLTESLLPKNNSEVTVTHNGRNIRLQAEEYTISARLIEGRYPHYNAVIPKDYSDSFTVQKSDLLAAIRRVKVFSDSTSLLIRFKIENMMLNLKAEDINYNSKAEECVFGEVAGNNIDAGLKASNMIEMLNTIHSEKVRIMYKDPGRPFLFYPMDEQDNPMIEQTCLLMPMMI